MEIPLRTGQLWQAGNFISGKKMVNMLDAIRMASWSIQKFSRMIN